MIHYPAIGGRHPELKDPAVYSVQVYSRGDQIRQLSQLELEQTLLEWQDLEV